MQELESDLRIYAKGSAFEDNKYDLRSLEILISGYRTILDRLVAVQLGRRQLSKLTKRQLNYEVKIKDGSIELLIDFILQHPEVVTAAAAVMTEDGGFQLSNTLTKIYRDAISPRKAAAKFIENGLSFDIKITNSFNIGSNNVNVNNETQEIIIPDAKILWAAQATRAATDKVLRKIDGSQIEYIDLDSKDTKVTLSEGEKIILGRDKQILPAKLKIVGRLDMIAFSSHRGSIVSERETFPVTWDEKIRSEMQRMADREGIIFTVNPIIDHSRLDQDAIGFHVLDCENPQSSMEF